MGLRYFHGFFRGGAIYIQHVSKGRMGSGLTRIYRGRDKELLRSIRKGDGDMRSFNTALEKGANVNCSFDYGWTALHWAAFKGRETMVEILVDRGAKQKKNNDKNYPIDIACFDAPDSADKQLRDRIVKILKDASPAQN